LPEFEEGRDLQLAVIVDARPPQAGEALHYLQIVADLSSHPWTRTGTEIGFPAVVKLEEWARSGRVPLDTEPLLRKVAEKGIQAGVESFVDFEVSPFHAALDVVGKGGEHHVFIAG